MSGYEVEPWRAALPAERPRYAPGRSQAPQQRVVTTTTRVISADCGCMDEVNRRIRICRQEAAQIPIAAWDWDRGERAALQASAGDAVTGYEQTRRDIAQWGCHGLCTDRWADRS